MKKPGQGVYESENQGGNMPCHGSGKQKSRKWPDDTEGGLLYHGHFLLFSAVSLWLFRKGILKTGTVYIRF